MQMIENVSFLTHEYQSIVSDVDGFDRESLKEQLVRDADWTFRGAEEVLYLAERYGSFILRNALALSLALGIEDGDTGL